MVKRCRPGDSPENLLQVLRGRAQDKAVGRNIQRVIRQMTREEREQNLAMARIMEIGKGGRPRVIRVKVIKVRMGHERYLIRVSNGQRLNPETTKLLKDGWPRMYRGRCIGPGPLPGQEAEPGKDP